MLRTRDRKDRLIFDLLMAGTALGTVLAAAPAAAATLTWTNLSTGDWFDPSNWDGGAAPTAADEAVVDNGGVARASGAVAPGAARLRVGSGAGATAGAVETEGLDLALGAAANALQVGAAAGAGAAAAGALTVDGDLRGPTPGSQFGDFAIGVANGDGASGEGRVSVAGDMRASIFSFANSVGLAQSGDGAAADGHLMVGGDLTGLRVVGLAFPGATGASARGAVTVGGSLTPAADFFIVGQTLAPTSTVDGSVEAGVLRATNGAWGIGQAAGGEARGFVQASSIEGDDALAFLSVGNANGGVASGELLIDAGGVRVDGSATIGAATAGGEASGAVSLGGALTSDGGGTILSVGVANAFAPATGSVGAGALTAEGVAGFRDVLIGRAVAGGGAEATATGEATIGDGGLVNAVDPGGSLLIGVAATQVVSGVVTGAGPAAEGTATIAGDVLGYTFVRVGQVQNSGTATGMLAIEGGEMRTTVLQVGVIDPPDETLATSGAAATARGRLEATDARIVATAGGTFSFGGVFVGEFLPSPAAGGGTPLDARGAVALTRSTLETDVLVIGGGGSAEVSAGDSRVAASAVTVRGGAGGAAVSLQNSELEVKASPLGFAGALQLAGLDSTLTAVDSSVSLDGSLIVQQSSPAAGQATGRVALERSTLAVGDNVFLGGDGADTRAEMRLVDSAATVEGAVVVGRAGGFGEALLELDASAMSVGGMLLMRPTAELAFGVRGLGRGLGGYGALDVGSAALDGLATVDFGGLTGPLGFMRADFDLLFVASGVTGDFASVALRNVPQGYAAVFGFAIEGEGDVWRVTLSRDVAPVPLPAAGWLLLGGLASLAALRRRAG